MVLHIAEEHTREGLAQTMPEERAVTGSDSDWSTFSSDFLLTHQARSMRQELGATRRVSRHHDAHPDIRSILRASFPLHPTTLDLLFVSGTVECIYAYDEDKQNLSDRFDFNERIPEQLFHNLPELLRQRLISAARNQLGVSISDRSKMSLILEIMRIIQNTTPPRPWRYHGDRSRDPRRKSQVIKGSSDSIQELGKDDLNLALLSENKAPKSSTTTGTLLTGNIFAPNDDGLDGVEDLEIGDMFFTTTMAAKTQGGDWAMESKRMEGLDFSDGSEELEIYDLNLTGLAVDLEPKMNSSNHSTADSWRTDVQEAQDELEGVEDLEIGDLYWMSKGF